MRTIKPWSFSFLVFTLFWKTTLQTLPSPHSSRIPFAKYNIYNFVLYQVSKSLPPSRNLSFKPYYLLTAFAHLSQSAIFTTLCSIKSWLLTSLSLLSSENPPFTPCYLLPHTLRKVQHSHLIPLWNPHICFWVSFFSRVRTNRQLIPPRAQLFWAPSEGSGVRFTYPAQFPDPWVPVGQCNPSARVPLRVKILIFTKFANNLNRTTAWTTPYKM